MSKAVLISIRPKWCELIASGKKTIEVRKTKPKLKTPFKCYIYETKGKVERAHGEEGGYHYQEGRSAVIGEFVCDKIYEIKNAGYAFKVGKTCAETNVIARASCLAFTDMHDYFGQKGGYGWHISDLVLYDKPKKLTDFWRLPCERISDCGNCHKFDRTNLACKRIPIVTRPPNSWCYVEELT